MPRRALRQKREQLRAAARADARAAAGESADSLGPQAPAAPGGAPPSGALDATPDVTAEGSCSGFSEDSLVHLTVLATNDFHGALESKTYPWSQAGRPVGGAATLAAFIERERADNPEGTLLLDGGDLMQGTAISNLTQGKSAIDYFNAVGYDAAAIGNHEFDWGIDVLEERIAQSSFPLLSANIVSKADGRRPAWARPTATVRRKGLTIGIVGLTTLSTPTTTLPVNVADLRFTDLAQAVETEAADLEREGADLVVVLAHAGGTFRPDSRSFAGEIVDAMRRMPPSVDLVVSGHTHTLLEGTVNGIPLVQARSRGTALAVVQLWVDPRNRRVACSESEVETTYGDLVQPDSVVAAIVEQYHDRLDAITERVVAEAAHPLTADRRRESVLGDLIADAPAGRDRQPDRAHELGRHPRGDRRRPDPVARGVRGPALRQFALQAADQRAHVAGGPGERRERRARAGAGLGRAASAWIPRPRSAGACATHGSRTAPSFGRARPTRSPSTTS